MKNQWVADSADFGKYGLLRALCDPRAKDEYRPLSLGVVWYTTPDDYQDDSKADKDAFAHLEACNPIADRYKDCDPALHKKLAKIHSVCPKHIDQIERGGVLPNGTVFFQDSMPLMGNNDYKEERKGWARRALAATENCELVFLDPDTGLQPDSTAENNKTKPEHARFDELKPYVERCQSLVLLC